MQTAGRFVENVESASGSLLRQFGCEFYPLRFAAGKSGGGLAQPKITEPHIQHRVQFIRHARNISEKTCRLVHGQIEHIGNVLSFISDFERLAIVASTMTHFALDINVRQKVHFDFDQPAALAVFAATTFDIEAETPRVIPTDARGRKLCEQFANRCERTTVSDWIRSRRTPNRTLINHNSLVDLIDPAQTTKRPRLFLRIVEMTEQCSAQNIVHQSRFAAAGHTGHTNETTERKRCIDVLEI